MRRQNTVKEEIFCTGVGLHSGKEVTLRIKPAEINTGIVFTRRDIGLVIPARAEYVVETLLCTTLGRDGHKVQTVEHLLATLSQLSVDNAIVELDADEIPILDGSAEVFVHLIKKAGLAQQPAPRPFLKVLKELTVTEGERRVTIQPSPLSRVTYFIDFDHPLLYQQSYSYLMADEAFAKDIAKARTFGFLNEVEQLRSMGLARGGSLDNAIVVDQNRILNKGGLRYRDEFVRHKILDILGDMALVGYPIIGHIVASRSGHALHVRAAVELLAHPDRWVLLEEDPAREDPYPLDLGLPLQNPIK